MYNGNIRMKLKVGEYYKNRSGNIVHIVEHDTYGTPDSESHGYVDEEGNTYMLNGAYADPYNEHELDLIGVQF
jgi:hypothetical protein